MSSDDSGIIAPASDNKRKREDENEDTDVDDPSRQAKKAKVEDRALNQGGSSSPHPSARREASDRNLHGPPSTGVSPHRGSPRLPYRGIPWWGMHGPDFRLRKLPTSPLAPNPATRIPFNRRSDYYDPDDGWDLKDTLNRAAHQVYVKTESVFRPRSLVYIVASHRFL